MSKPILCTIDFSESSRQTMKCAATLARDLHAHLTILYTYRLIRVKNDEVFERKKKIEERAAQNFIAIEEELLKDLGISYDFKTEVGFVADRVEAYTRKTPIGFLVIDKNMTVESKETFDELMENMQVPMVIVP
ncbi:MAG TPA: universal stress protein [Cyclobacteriaceae bacterium]